MANAQAAAIEQQVEADRRATGFEIARSSRQFQSQQGQAIAQVGASGVGLAGSPTDTLVRNAGEHQMDIEAIRYGSLLRRNNLQTQPEQTVPEPAEVDEGSSAVLDAIDAIYTAEELSAELRQAEILSNLSQWFYDGNETIGQVHEFCIVLSQDCDLLWDHDAWKKDGQGTLNGALIFEAEALDLKRAKLPPGSEAFKRIKQNKDERYHVLAAVPAARDSTHAGIPALIINFKRYFTLPPAEIYRQCALENGAVRRSRMQTPFREHLQNRAAFYLQRVTLP